MTYKIHSLICGIAAAKLRVVTNAYVTLISVTTELYISVAYYEYPTYQLNL
jgi:hypothetical protein